MQVYPAYYGPVSAAVDYTTPPIPLGDNGNIAVGITLSGADVVGSISVVGSMTEAFTRPFLLQTATAVTASADTLVSINDINVPWVRVFWDYTSGTGNITIDLSIRQSNSRG